MKNYKVRVKNEAESKEVQGLLFELGCSFGLNKTTKIREVKTPETIMAFNNGAICFGVRGSANHQELTIPQLRDLLVLKRNDVADATHVGEIPESQRGYLTVDGVEYFWNYFLNKWNTLSALTFENQQLKPIEKKEMKEFLVNHDNKWTLQLLDADTEENSYRVAVPSGAECMTKNGDNKVFWKDGAVNFTDAGKGWDYNHSLTFSDYLSVWDGEAEIVWQRHTHPEELPFVDDEPKGINKGLQDLAQAASELSKRVKNKSMGFGFVPLEDDEPTLNDTCVEIEQVRQDAINNPNHYTSGNIECLDAMQAMLSPDEFIGFLRGNIFKYQWRYKLKNGVEDLKKAQFYQNKLIELESKG